MKKIFIVIIAAIISVAILVFLFAAEQKEEKEVEVAEMKTVKNITLITLYDNYQYNQELSTGLGFSCLVRLDNKSILFDTGADSPTLLGNSKKLCIDLKEIDAIVLSHEHWDHVGGLSGVLEKNPNVTVYLPSSFPASFKANVKNYGTKVIEVSNATKVSDAVWTTGELGTFIKEQSLIINTNKGLVIITGCAHPGIVSIVEESKKLTGKEVHLVIGGFHYPSANVVGEFRELGVQKVAPCHCSGDKIRELFKEEYKEDFIANGVGKIIKI